MLPQAQNKILTEKNSEKKRIKRRDVIAIFVCHVLHDTYSVSYDTTHYILARGRKISKS